MDRVRGTKYSVWHQRPGEMGRHHYRCLFHMELNLTIVSGQFSHRALQNRASHLQLCVVLPSPMPPTLYSESVLMQMNSPSATMFAINTSGHRWNWCCSCERNRLAHLLTSTLIDIYSAEVIVEWIVRKNFRTCRKQSCLVSLYASAHRFQIESCAVWSNPLI